MKGIDRRDLGDAADPAQTEATRLPHDWISVPWAECGFPFLGLPGMFDPRRPLGHSGASTRQPDAFTLEQRPLPI